MINWSTDFCRLKYLHNININDVLGLIWQYTKKNIADVPLYEFTDTRIET